MKFTTSWDDGYTLDLKLADVLDVYGCKGTFYVCPRKQHSQTMLTEQEILQLSNRHEIGAHTLRHPKLTEISVVEARAEIVDSKAWVEQVTGTPCNMFCYPYGFYNDDVKRMVKEAGFKGARTTERLQFGTSDLFTMPTTLQVTPFPKRKTWSRWWHPLDPFGPLRVRRKQLKALGIKGKCFTSWLDLAICPFDRALELEKSKTLNSTTFAKATAGKQLSTLNFHLWGHSYEIEKYSMWGELEEFCKHVQKAEIECVTNNAIAH